jgi:hypothetical protein
MMTLKLILIITLCAPNLHETERVYEQTLGYVMAGRGRISSELSREWNAPNMSGHEYILLRPASAAKVYLRIVQTTPVAEYRPMSTFGWNAIEMMVQDPDALAGTIRERGSGFDLVGEPRPLGPASAIRAMQATGPAHEVLYLTKLPNVGNLPAAHTFVDRPFIMVLGNRSLADARYFWRDVLGVDGGALLQARMTVLNKAFGLDIETLHPLSLARLSPEYAIEMDQYPGEATERPHAPGELPPAISLVSFETDSLQSVSSLLLAPPERIDQAPYHGRRAGTLRGTSGELIELIENESTTSH